MSVAKPTRIGRGPRIIAERRHAPMAAAKPVPAAIDIEALFEDTMRRYPNTMARLAE